MCLVGGRRTERDWWVSLDLCEQDCGPYPENITLLAVTRFQRQIHRLYRGSGRSLTGLVVKRISQFHGRPPKCFGLGYTPEKKLLRSG